MDKTLYAVPLSAQRLSPPLVPAAVKSGFFTTSDGVKLHYLECGAGPIVLFVPGWTMPAQIWQPQIDFFSRRYHVVALDPRSQGGSHKPDEGNYPGRRARDYRELIEALGGSPVVMVAWSLAVLEGLTYVEMFGTFKLNGLVLIDFPVYTPSTREERNRRHAMLHDLQANRKHFADTFVREMYRKPQTEEYLQSIVAASLRTPTNSAVALLAERAVKTDLRPALRNIRIPVLAAMTGANRRAAELIRSTVPAAQAEIFEDAGHCLFVDDADRFNLLLENFIEKVSPQ